jgi:galactokinase
VTSTTQVEAFAPGRVNLIGDHVDYCGGPVLPMAIDLGTTVRAEEAAGWVELVSLDEPQVARVPVDVDDPAAVSPPWARYVAGVVAGLRPAHGVQGTVATTVPIGAGLSSSAALELAVALALGFRGSTLELAQLGQEAEQRASGVPCGIMDQLASAAGVAGHALLIDGAALTVVPVPFPEDLAVLVVHSGEPRGLAGSAYAERRSECEAAAAIVGPLPLATSAEVEALTDPVLRRRARHVASECARVRAVADSAFDRGVLAETMARSHASLRDDFEVSTPRLDALVAHLSLVPGVVGARLTGAGFGGCAVALVDTDAVGRAAESLDRWQWWRVHPSAGAGVLTR